MIVYFNGAFGPKSQVRISPDDRGFLFGDGVYEVVRACRGRLFAADAHVERLARSLRALEIEGVAARRMVDVAIELLARNGLDRGEAKVYFQVTRGAAPRRHAFPDPPVPPTVYATANAVTLPKAQWRDGVKVILVPDTRWGRRDIKSLNLLPNVLASQRARAAGAYDAVFVGDDGVVTEGAHTSVAAVFDGVLVTHPLTPRVLPGVTREVMLDLCARLGIPVDERPIPVARVRQAQELMLLGTTTEVMPVVRVEEDAVGAGAPGPVTRRLQGALRARMSCPTPGSAG
jgi:D-alanine transaminase